MKVKFSILLVILFFIPFWFSPSSNAASIEFPPANSTDLLLGPAFANKTSPVQIYFNRRKVKTTKESIVYYQGSYMLPIKPLFCDQGPKFKYEYLVDFKRTTIEYDNNLFSFFKDDSYYYKNGIKCNFIKKPIIAHFKGQKIDYIFISLQDLINAFNLTYTFDPKVNVLRLFYDKPDLSGDILYTNYAYSKSDYAKQQYKKYRKVTLKTYKSLFTLSNDTTNNFQYLRVDSYRDVDEDKFTSYYDYLIREYCRVNKMSPKKSVLYNKSKTVLKAAKKYNIDPLFFASQTFQESAYGTSKLAKGSTIKKVVTKKCFFSKNKKKISTRRLKKKTKVYNLYGIKAYDDDPFLYGTSYAYFQKWTTVSKAIYGAAKYLSTEYLGEANKQNTPFKIRYSQKKSLWHQYATDPYYAEAIGKRMYLISSVYSEDAKYTYDFPKFK